MGNHPPTFDYGLFRTDIPTLPGHSPELMYIFNFLILLVALLIKITQINVLLECMMEIKLSLKLSERLQRDFQIISFWAQETHQKRAHHMSGKLSKKFMT